MRILLFILLSISAEAATDSIYQVDWPRDAALTGLFFAAGGAPYLLSNQIIDRRCPCDGSGINALDRWAVGQHSDFALTLSDVGVAGALLTPLALDYFSLGEFNTAFWEDALIYAEVLAVTGAITSVTKHLVQRPVPRSYEGDPEYTQSSEGYRSFFSGHASTTAAALGAAAMQLRLRNKSGAWTWVLPLGGGALIGTARILGGVHFVSDVLVGIGVGTTVGTLIPYLHRLNTSSPVSLWLAPQQEGAVAIFSTRW